MGGEYRRRTARLFTPALRCSTPGNCLGLNSVVEPACDERREDMRQMLLRLDGKVFTTASLDQLVIHARLKEFVTTAQHEQSSPKGS
jgi:hypothetical protein